MAKPISYSTQTIVIYLIYSMSKWISTYFELLPSIGISSIAALLSGSNGSQPELKKRDSKCIYWKSLRDLILAHPDTKKRVDVFALSISGLVIFPKALGHIDEAVSDLFNRLDKSVTPIPTILAETFRSLSACRRAGEGRFIGCVQLLLAWFHNHFWKVENVSYRVFSDNYSPLKELVATLRAHWMIPDEILYRCGDFDWVFLLGIWGAIGYDPLLVLRVNVNVPVSSQKNTWSIEEHLQVVLSELEIIKQDFEKMKAEEMRKGKNKAEEYLDSLKIDYKKLRLSMRTAGLYARVRENALKRDLLESRNEKVGLRSGVAELERSLHQYCSHNSAIEWKASLNKIEELKGKIEELETAL
ncbi:hypothetical protein Gogos_021902 [Gossypium gossypioides]|uniref:DUF7745 domain-containing protein n=1 Tax=Gossypium gossypioides TaxID=34282 RepID=A0A7J9D746_GOSGO|nr:hypothetical protein [Gossypium gossypioides]